MSARSLVAARPLVAPARACRGSIGSGVMPTGMSLLTDLPNEPRRTPL
ncbi:hypothetical protein [Kribbella qitaiheensis]|nr:hypothetical protein [Kribbella qitaiheensis]